MTQNNPAILALRSRLARQGPERLLTPLTLTTTLESSLLLSSLDRCCSGRTETLRGLLEVAQLRSDRAGVQSHVVWLHRARAHPLGRNTPPPQAPFPDAVLSTHHLLWLLSKAGSFSLRGFR